MYAIDSGRGIVYLSEWKKKSRYEVVTLIS